MEPKPDKAVVDSLNVTLRPKCNGKTPKSLDMKWLEKLFDGMSEEQKARFLDYLKTQQEEE